jgi:hypothetical protein
MEVIRKFRWKRALLMLGLAISLALIGVFAIRTVHYMPRARVDEPIRPWMNLPYIAHSYHVPARLLFQALGLTMTIPIDRRPIMDIARDQHRPVQILINFLEEAITQARSGKTAPPSPTSVPVRSVP